MAAAARPDLTEAAQDLRELVGTPLAEASSTWTDRDVLLYNLGIGAGAQPTDERELRYIFERDLVVLPSYASVACSDGLIGFRSVPGLDLTGVVVLHGEHRVEILEPIPVSAAVTHAGRLAEVYDRGRGALVRFEVDTALADTGTVLFRNTATFYMKGLGGFGGPSVDGSAPLARPEREPDRTASVALLPQQAAIYRLCGDRNPIHVDPAAAGRAGYEQPLMHGLCTYGVVCKAVVDGALDGDPAALRSYRGKFTSHVFPGEHLEISLWSDGDQVTAEAVTRERGLTVFVATAMTA